MGGLLYKDFISVKGKLNVWTMVVLTVLFLVLRVQFPGTEDLKGFIVENALFTDIESVREYAKEKKICKVVVVDCDSVEDEI